MTPEQLAVRTAAQHSATAFEAHPMMLVAKRPGFQHNVVTVGDNMQSETCNTELVRTIMSGGVKILVGFCPHGIMGWLNQTPPQVKPTRRLRRVIERQARRER